MSLKSEGFASDLYDPDSAYPLKAYCAEHGIDYADVALPVRIETFIAYGLEFQRRYVPALENTQVISLHRRAEYFELTTDAGEIARARRVVIAVGIMHYAYLPPLLSSHPDTMISHSSKHSDLSKFSGRRVGVLGAGASAIDIAVILHQAGATTELIARRPAIQFHDPPAEPRSLYESVKAPRSGLGTGWRSRMCTDIPLVFHMLPQSLRHRAVERHLGPAPCWFTRDAMVGHVPMHLGVTVGGADARNGSVRILLRHPERADTELEFDHLIGATGYKVDISRLTFLDGDLQSDIRQAEKTPILDRHFESSVPGLYFVGISAANCFGPLLRFAYGAKFAARRLTARFA